MHLKIPPPAILLVAAALLYVSTLFLPVLTISFPLQTAVAVVFAVAGLALDLRSVFAFFRQKTTINPLSPQKTSRLVTTGFYRFTRNPMYLGMLFLLIGFAIYLGSLAAILIVPGFVWYLTAFQIKPEEESLGQNFGQTYTDYCDRVRRWI